jgi:chromosome segregation ATPase
LDSLRILFTPHKDDSSQEYRDKLDALDMLAQQEYGMTLVNCDEASGVQEKITELESELASLGETRGELEQSRRDLATRTGERNGARQRIAILEDEVKEREMKELQLREEPRLEREEDPLAYKIFVELSDLRKQLEEAEEKAKSLPELQKLYEEVDGQRAVAEQRLVVMQQHLVDAEARTKEGRERLADANEQQSAAEQDKAVMQQRLTDATATVRELREILVDVGRSADQEKAHNDELQSKLSEANDQLASLKAIISAKDAEIIEIKANLLSKQASHSLPRNSLQHVNN